MMTKLKLTAILAFGIATLSFAQGKTPDFWLTVGKTNYFIDLSKGNAKAKNDTVFYNLYRYGGSKLIGKEVKHIVNKTTGDTLKSGSFEVMDNRILFFVKENKLASYVNIYTQNEKGLLSLTKGVRAVSTVSAIAPAVPAPAYDNTGRPEKVDVMAEFPGGINKARAFIADNLMYPEEAQENEVEATARVKFVVEKDGAVTNIKLEKKLGYGFHEEVMRIFKRMPKWKPALLNGKSVRSQFAMPITFRLQ